MNVNDQRPTPGADTDGPPRQGGGDRLSGSTGLVAWHTDGSSPEDDGRDEGRPPFTPEQLDAALERWR